MIGGAVEREGLTAVQIADRIDSIYDTTLLVLRTAGTTHATPLHEAEVLARQAIAKSTAA